SWRWCVSDCPPLIQTVTRPDGSRGLRYNLHPGQERAWDSEKPRVAVIAGVRSGKALAVDTPIPTPDGFRPMGDMSDGDLVFAGAGRVCRVVGVSGVYLPAACFRVTFDDGSSLVADGDHQWLTSTSKQRKNAARRVAGNEAWREKRPRCRPAPDASVVTTEE